MKKNPDSEGGPYTSMDLLPHLGLFFTCSIHVKILQIFIFIRAAVYFTAFLKMNHMELRFAVVPYILNIYKISISAGHVVSH
jgi:hypothetical protein